MPLDPWRVHCPWTVARTVEEREAIELQWGIAAWCRAIVLLVRVQAEAVRA